MSASPLGGLAAWSPEASIPPCRGPREGGGRSMNVVLRTEEGAVSLLVDEIGRSSRARGFTLE